MGWGVFSDGRAGARSEEEDDRETRQRRNMMIEMMEKRSRFARSRARVVRTDVRATVKMRVPATDEV